MPRDPHKLYPHDQWMKAIVLPFIPRFITPNHVTILRFILIPFVAFLLINTNYIIGVPLFVFTAFTDAIDGSLARVRKKVTRWGTFYDPVADKILISVVVLILVSTYISTWFGAIIVLMESLIALGGYVHRKEGKMQSANAWGKAKMFAQVSGLTILLIAVATGTLSLIPLSAGVLTLGIMLAVISLYTYGL